MARTAFVTLVMHNLEYVGGALVLAQSLRAAGTRADLVVMVTPEVPQEARDVLARAFTRVVAVQPITARALQRPTKRPCFDGMYQWLDSCFTKLEALGLVEYEKVVFLDADMLACSGQDPDALFELPAPAGICSSVKDAANGEWHGKRLSAELVETALRRDYGIRGCCLVLSPDPAKLEEARQMLRGGEYGSVNNIVGPDELLVTRLYEGGQEAQSQWTHVHARYGCTSWHAEKLGAPPVILHFVSEKPWAPKDPEKPWPDFQVRGAGRETDWLAD